MQYKQVTYTYWGEFKGNISQELFGEDPFDRGLFLFRGQADDRWQLKSSFDRLLGQTADSRNQSKLFERLLRKFKEEVEIREGRELNSDEASLLAFAQHHGLPTRALDWSESPYVAAFFAFSEALILPKSPRRVAIWALNSTDSRWEGHLEILRPAPKENRRQRNQLGVFTRVTSNVSCLEQVSCAGNGEGLIQFLVPAHEAQYALADLDAMGISFGSLFPDIEGAVREAKYRVLRTG